MTFDLILATLQVDFHSLGHDLVGTVAFGVLGIVLMLAGFKLFEVITRKLLDIEEQLDSQNMAAGVVGGSILLGISLIEVV